jgi:D-alanyl-lipoteichoic acid acyltransferase DltB (MBOAT superfamily)
VHDERHISTAGRQGTIDAVDGTVQFNGGSSEWVHPGGPPLRSGGQIDRPEEATGVLFPTMTFALFFVVVLGVSWRLADRPLQWKLFVLAASYVFYGWADWMFCLLLAGSTVGNWLVALALARAGSDRGRRAWMGLGVTLNLLLLGFFKYYGFFVDSVLAALEPLGLAPTALLVQIALPVGISFFTFCAISYVIDVYRDEQEPVALLDFAVYLAFFPHLVAGPIVRVSEFEPQLRRRRNPQAIDATRAVRLICRGLFKKVVIANYLATAIVDPVFVAPSQHTNWELLVGAWAYAVQIYADFSGYTDIAIGIALMMGIKFPDNFDQPYSSRSIQEFWRRWHMTLSRWLRDYLYIPLGGNRGGPRAEYRNLFLTMLLGGLWHGASWNFVIWGAFHGCGLAVERWHAMREPKPAYVDLGAAGDVPPGERNHPAPYRPDDATLVMQQPTEVERRTMNPWLARLWVFHFVVVGWIFFRAPDLGVAISYLVGLLTNWGVGTLVTWTVLLAIAVGMVGQFVPRRVGDALEYRASKLPPMVLAVGVGLWLVMINLLGPQGVAPFIYFQF